MYLLPLIVWASEASYILLYLGITTNFSLVSEWVCDRDSDPTDAYIDFNKTSLTCFWHKISVSLTFFPNGSHTVFKVLKTISLIDKTFLKTNHTNKNW